VNVLELAVAKSAQADQGPARSVAVQYILSFGALVGISILIFNLFTVPIHQIMGRGNSHHPLS
jgi:hypothetical protein